MILRPRATGQDRRRHGQQPQGHRQPARQRRRPKPTTRSSRTGRCAYARSRSGQATAVPTPSPSATNACSARAAGNSVRGRRRAPPGCGPATNAPNAVDVLFIDEAGQFSLANALAVSPAAKSIVLLGDPQQLDQPIKGSHPRVRSSGAGPPPGRGRDHASRAGPVHGQDLAAPPGHLRLHLGGLLRSELVPGPATSCRPRGAGPPDGAGIRFVPVEHAGNAQHSSPEEARAIADLVERPARSGARWIDRDSKGHPSRLETSSSSRPTTRSGAHREIQQGAVPAHTCRSGTVDKFQGQQAPISIYSMATSRPEDAPRGMEFLYSLNRLNVATSRARCLTLVVASPALISAQARTPTQMVLANALCRLDEVARGAGAGPCMMHRAGGADHGRRRHARRSRRTGRTGASGYRPPRRATG